VGEAARGEQLIANQGQEWMGILFAPQEKEAGSPVSKKKGWIM
jgi:hypothetical protein